MNSSDAIINPFFIMGLPPTSELPDEEIEEAYRAKAAKLEAADDAGHLNLQNAYKLLKERGELIKKMRESDRRLDSQLMQKGLYGEERSAAKRTYPVGTRFYEQVRWRKVRKLLRSKSSKSPGGACQEQAGSNNNKTCCS